MLPGGTSAIQAQARRRPLRCPAPPRCCRCRRRCRCTLRLPLFLRRGRDGPAIVFNVWQPARSRVLLQVGAINVGATPQRRARSFWSSQHTGERRAAICTGADAACGWDAARGREPPSVGPSRSHHAALRCAALCGAVCAVTLAPTQLDALDCLALDYQVGWPLSAVLTEASMGAWAAHGLCRLSLDAASGPVAPLAPLSPMPPQPGPRPSPTCRPFVGTSPGLQDTLQGYAAVFSWMVRLRRAEQLLRAAAPPLAAQPKSSADLLLSEEEADKAHRRVQALRAFRFGAAQFVTALQAFLQSRTTGGEAGLGVLCWGRWRWQCLLPPWNLQPFVCVCVCVRPSPQTHSPFARRLLCRGCLGAPAGKADGQLRGGGGHAHQPAAQR